jgi:hypothetical protein
MRLRLTKIGKHPTLEYAMDELAKYIRDNCTLTVSKRGAGGFYDEVAEDFKNKSVTKEGSSYDLTLTRTKSYYYDFAGDYMLRGFENKVKREIDGFVWFKSWELGSTVERDTVWMHLPLDISMI